MGVGETMDLKQLADYLQRDMREVSKLASRGNLPGRKVGGEWRFARAEINLWIEQQMHAYTEQQLTALEANHDGPEDTLVSSLLSDASRFCGLRPRVSLSCQRVMGCVMTNA